MISASKLSYVGYGWIHSPQALIVAYIFAFISILVSTAHITKHLLHYSMPGVQIYVIRILGICPVYALSSAISLGVKQYGSFADVFRDVYEAFVIYSFLNLVLEYCGGETDCIHQIENDPDLRLPFPLCMMKPMPRDARLMRFCQRGVLQFVLVKPIVAILDLAMISCGLYFHRGYQWFEMSIYNISYTWALFCLYVFYLATKKLIKGFRPVLKFATIKALVFATYYQSLAVRAGPISAEDGHKWNDLLLCVEMFIFSILLMFAFPVSEFKGGMKNSAFLVNVKNVLTVRDVVQDMYHNFTPVYENYALQRSDHEAVEMLRSTSRSHLSGNLDSVAREMSARYRGPNKRLAFNALLRGDKPIRAKLRNNHTTKTKSIYSFNNIFSFKTSNINNGTENMDISEDKASTVCNSSHGLLTHSNNNNVNNQVSSTSAGVVTTSWPPLNDISGIPNGGQLIRSRSSSFFSVNSDRTDESRRLPATHGIGIIVSDKGVSMREWNEFPTEEENIVNVEFMGSTRVGLKDALFDFLYGDMDTDDADKINSISTDHNNSTTTHENRLINRKSPLGLLSPHRQTSKTGFQNDAKESEMSYDDDVGSQSRSIIGPMVIDADRLRAALRTHKHSPLSTHRRAKSADISSTSSSSPTLNSSDPSKLSNSKLTSFPSSPTLSTKRKSLSDSGVVISVLHDKNPCSRFPKIKPPADPPTETSFIPISSNPETVKSGSESAITSRSSSRQSFHINSPPCSPSNQISNNNNAILITSSHGPSPSSPASASTISLSNSISLSSPTWRLTSMQSNSYDPGSGSTGMVGVNTVPDKSPEWGDFSHITRNINFDDINHVYSNDSNSKITNEEIVESPYTISQARKPHTFKYSEDINNGDVDDNRDTIRSVIESIIEKIEPFDYFYSHTIISDSPSLSTSFDTKPNLSLSSGHERNSPIHNLLDSNDHSQNPEDGQSDQDAHNVSYDRAIIGSKHLVEAFTPISQSSFDNSVLLTSTSCCDNIIVSDVVTI